MLDTTRIVVVTPAGRRRYLEILFRYILKLRPIMDEYRLWVNTENNEDIEDDLHDKLLDLVREHDSKITKMNERKAAKRTRKNRKTSKTGTKRVK